MPIISGGGGTFNGGTITRGLEIAPSAAPTSLLGDFVVDTAQLVADGNTVVLFQGPSGPFFEIDSNGGGSIRLLGGGSLVFVDNLAGTAALTVTPDAGGSKMSWYGGPLVARPSVTSGSVTPAQLANALQANGFLGGT